VTDRPKAAEEPMVQIMASYYGDASGRRQIPVEPRWIVLAWLADRPTHLQTWGPFLTKTLAREFGKEYFPRRYRVSGLFDPARKNFYRTGKSAAAKTAAERETAYVNNRPTFPPEDAP
jgi:hypothetical protein